MGQIKVAFILCRFNLTINFKNSWTQQSSQCYQKPICLGFCLKEVFDANLYSMESKKNTYDEKFEVLVLSHPISRSENYKMYFS